MNDKVFIPTMALFWPVQCLLFDGIFAVQGLSHYGSCMASPIWTTWVCSMFAFWRYFCAVQGLFHHGSCMAPPGFIPSQDLFLILVRPMLAFWRYSCCTMIVPLRQLHGSTNMNDQELPILTQNLFWPVQSLVSDGLFVVQGLFHDGSCMSPPIWTTRFWSQLRIYS